MSFDDGDFLPEMLQYFDEFCSRIDDDNKLEGLYFLSPMFQSTSQVILVLRMLALFVKELTVPSQVLHYEDSISALSN